MTRFRSLAFLILLIAATAAASWGQVVISVRFGPPVLPVYAQPLCPGPGYIWTPGYWAWSPDDDGYYWVPGTWVIAPEPGFLWTPGLLGLFEEGCTFGTPVSGDLRSDSTVALTTDSVTPVPDTTVAIGTAATSTTTAPSTT